MALLKLPIGIQTFSEIRTEGYIYIDKTSYLCDLANQGKYYFFSRPRRFGKSLTISTLRAMFSGQKELFNGLYADENWDWEKTSPVLHFAFNAMSYEEIGLEKSLHQELDIAAKERDISLESQGISNRFRELIQKLHIRDGKVVILIDEYDKPLIDYLTKDLLHRARENQIILRSFYGVLKEADPHLRFLFITGISKFSQTSIFSQLNNLRDLTLEKKYGALVGYTHDELWEHFTPYMNQILPDLGITQDEAWERLREWYNGYTWNLKDFVYNPFSILQFFAKASYENYWFQSGAPKFLIDLLREKEVFKVENQVTSFDSLNAYDIESIDPLVLMFQTGYLTLKSKDQDGFVVIDYPNREVRNSIYQYMLAGFSGYFATNSLPTVFDMRTAFLKESPSQVAQVLESLFASMPYDLMASRLEVHFQAVVYIAFRYLGVYIETEVKYAKGRADAIVHTPNRIWILEFKINQSADVALQQIKAKGYAEAYKASGKEIVGMGICLSTETRQMGDWVSEVLLN